MGQVYICAPGININSCKQEKPLPAQKTGRGFFFGVNFVKSNIWKYYIFKFFSQFFFFIPVLVLFFQENELSMTEIFLLESAYSIFVVILEIPTGAIGDYFGKKKSVASGSLIFTLGLAVYSFGSSFGFFLIGELICALGSSLLSGSDSALIYSTLKSLGRGPEFKKIEGASNSFMLVGVMLGGLIGGFIGHYSLRLTIACSALTGLFAFFVSLSMIEPSNNGPNKKRERYNELILNSLKIVKNHKLILWLFFYSSIVGGLGHLIFWFIQPYFTTAGIPVLHFGWIYTALSLTAIIASKYTHQIESWFGDKGSLIFLSLLAIIPALALGITISIYAIFLLSLVEVSYGISKTIYNDRILKIIPESKAATVLSINNLGFRIVCAGAGPVLGHLTDVYNVQYSLLSIAMSVSIFTIVMFLIYYFIPEHFHKNPERS